MYNEMEHKKQFVVFAIEEYRTRKGLSGKTAIGLFEKSGLLQYIEDFFDLLHSNGTEYLIADFDDYLRSRNADEYHLNADEKEAWNKIIH